MTTCCDEQPALGLSAECYTFPREVLTLSSYGSACGCCGETYILADLSPSTKKNCVMVSIVDVAKKAVGFSIKFKVGCVDHIVKVCNLPDDPAIWESFIYTVLATDAIFLTNNVKVSIVKADPTKRSIDLSFCSDCAITATAVTPLAADLTITVTPMAITSTAPKLGQFVAYSYGTTGLQGIEVFSPGKTNYAGFLNLPSGVPVDACCLPQECSCNAVGPCRTIQRTGKVTIPLSAPVPTPVAGTPLKLGVNGLGDNIVYLGAAPAGYVEFPYPYSLVLTPQTIGATLIAVILH